MKFIKRLFFTLIFLGLIIGGWITWQGYTLYQQALEKTSLEQMEQTIRSSEHYTQLSQLPEIYIDAVISAEDQRFYEHPGIDIIAIARAVWNDIKTFRFAEGGSTITQQLAKNMYFTQEKKLTRKVAEMFMAFKMEQEFDKDELLEFYVNTIYFGQNYYGIGNASLGYFGISPKEMNDYQSTLLAGIPNAPSVYALNNNLDLASQRQQQVLNRMKKLGYLTDEEMKQILAAA